MAEGSVTEALDEALAFKIRIARADGLCFCAEKHPVPHIHGLDDYVAATRETV